MLALGFVAAFVLGVAGGPAWLCDQQVPSGLRSTVMRACSGGRVGRWAAGSVMRQVHSRKTHVCASCWSERSE